MSDVPIKGQAGGDGQGNSYSKVEVDWAYCWDIGFMILSRICPNCKKSLVDEIVYEDCPTCKAHTLKSNVETNFWTCPKCEFHVNKTSREQWRKSREEANAIQAPAQA